MSTLTMGIIGSFACCLKEKEGNCRGGKGVARSSAALGAAIGEVAPGGNRRREYNRLMGEKVRGFPVATRAPTMRHLTLVAWALLVGAPLAANDPEPPDPNKGKENGPLTVRLVAKKKTYVLDRGGLTAEKYRAAIRDGTIAPPAVDLALELVNTSKQSVTVRVTGSTSALTYDLKGPAGAAVTQTVKAVKAGKAAAPPIVNVEIKPGGKHTIPITALDNSAVGRPRMQTFWTEEGTYTLSVQFRTSTTADVAAKAKGKAKKGLVAAGGVSRITTLESQAVKLTVKLK